MPFLPPHIPAATAVGPWVIFAGTSIFVDPYAGPHLDIMPRTAEEATLASQELHPTHGYG